MTEQNQAKRKETNIFIRVKFRETETVRETTWMYSNHLAHFSLLMIRWHKECPTV